MTHLTSKQADRAIGALLGAAAGDALGVPYEYDSRRLQGEPQMLGGGLGGLAPGQWSDDTEMAICIARVSATGADLRTDAAQEAIAKGFLEWFADDPPDVGIQTRSVLSAVGPGPVAPQLRAESARLHARTGRSAGNGSLMRTSPVALAHLGDPDAIADAARAISTLTHFDPVAGDACVLWCLAIDLAVRTGELDVRVGLPCVDAMWGLLLDEAETVEPSHYGHSNGWVVAALLGAWSAISRTAGFEAGVVEAVRGGGDTDTVAVIAGALLGARYGGSTVPFRYRRVLHGWPGLRGRDLADLALRTARGGGAQSDGWTGMASYGRSSRELVPHPDDPGVLLGAVGAVRPGVADSVVSLCRVEPLPWLAPQDHVEVHLIDREDANNDLRYVITDAALAVQTLRAEGKTVLLHCVHTHTRTPVVAAAYGALVTGSSELEALRRVQAVLPAGRSPRASIVAVLEG